MVECPNCGQQVRGAFCTNCGTRVEQPAPGGSGTGASATSAIRASDLQEFAERERAAAAEGSAPGDASDQPAAAVGSESSDAGDQIGSIPAAASGGYTSGTGYTETGGAGSTGGSYGGTGGSQSGYGSQGGFGGGTMAPGGRMTLGELFNRALQLYQENVALFLGVLAVVFVPQAIISAILPTLGALWGILDIVGIGALIVAFAARYQGRPISIEEAYGAVGVGGAVSLIVTGIIFGIAVAIGLILVIVPGVFLAVRWAFFIQTTVLEGAGIMDNLSRSWKLTEGHWWRIFGTALVVFIVAAIISAIIGAIFAAILGSRVGAAIGPLVDIVLYPFSMGVLTLLYFDIRREKEGFVPESADFGVAQPIS